MFIILIAVMVSHMCVCVSKFQQVIHFKYVQFIVYQLCLNKAIKNFKKGKTLTLLHVSVQSVASIGNTLNSVHLAVEAIQKTVDEYKKTMKLLQSGMNQHALKETIGNNQIISSLPALSELDNKTHGVSLKQDILYLHSFLEEVNSAPGEYQRWK